MHDRLKIRRFCDQDAGAAANLFFTAVQTGAQSTYTQKQRNAWAPRIPDAESWKDRMAAQHSLVAILDDQLVGIMTLTDQGIIDLAFVLPEKMGTGVAGELYAAILAEARTRKFSQLQTHASHMARRFFEKRNWRIVQQQTIVRDEVELTNFLMELDITQEENSL